ncbi:MAG: HAMP domain-containing sensor histidine kinase [Pirellulaceae bacterium]
MSAQQTIESTNRRGSWDSAAPWTATAEGHQRSLRSKLVLSLAAMCAIFMVIDEAVRRIVIQPAFEDLEQASAMRDTNRVMSAIKVESEHLRAIAEQGASRLPLQDLISQENSSAEDSIWSESSLHFEGVQWAALMGSDRSWRWMHFTDDQGTLIDERSDTKELTRSILDRIEESKNQPTDGLACGSDRRIHAYATTPIKQDGNRSGGKTSLKSGVEYHLIVGKELDDELIAELRRRTQVTFSIQVYHNHKFDEKIRTWEADQSTLVVEVPLVRHDHETLANLFVQVPRDVVQQAQHTTALARNVFVCGAAAALIMMLLQLQRIVIGPLTRIREHTERIAENGLDAGPLDLNSNDEIGALATAFDHMKLRLADTHKRLADASHAAGMSQVADTVIHNVGNVLTNVNSLIETSTDRVNGLRIAPLNKLATRLSQCDSFDAIVEATPDYLQRLSAELEKDQRELSDLLSTLNDNVQHIHSVIRDQRRHTMKSVDKKRFSILEIVNEAVSCCDAKLLQDQIKVQVSGNDYDIVSDRSLMLQIIINLIGNAGNAMSETECSSPILRIALTRHDGNVRLEVTDRGCGMTPETLSKVFDAHFTTRASGTGLGLHFCAIALKRLGGSITAHSDGLGMGSTFALELPIAQSVSNGDVPGVSIAPVAMDSSITQVPTQSIL